MKITIVAGTGEDRNGRAIGERELSRALASIRRHLASTFGGFTETVQTGGWVNGRGRLVMEPGTSWVVYADDAAGSPEEAARFVRDALRQDTVGLIVEPAAVYWIGAEGQEAVAA